MVCVTTATFGGVAALGFFLAAWPQLDYLVNGRETEATVTRMTSQDHDRFLRRLDGRPADAWRTEYTFAEANGRARTDVVVVPVPSELRPGSKVRIAYIPGQEGRSAIRSDGDRLSIWLFGGSVLVVLASLIGAGVCVVRRPHAVPGHSDA